MRYHTLFHFFFPFLGWMRAYTLAELKRDAVAGLTVALVLIPQSMANAQLAGLPAYHGLYAALLPAVVGGLWGSSRQMVTGIGAVTAVMAAAALQPLPITGPESYMAYMALLTLLVGLLQLLFGVFRLGMLVNFLSLPVISGFINAAAVIIAASQIGKLVGVSIDPAGSSIATLLHTLGAMWNYIHVPSLLMAAAALAVILLCTHYAPKLPAVLTAVVVCTAASWALGFEDNATVGLDRIRSYEVQALINRLQRNDDKAREYVSEIAALERDGTGRDSMEAQLRRQYAIQEKQLRLDIVREETALIRQHLRLTTFTGVAQPDGGMLFFHRRSPDISHLITSSGAGKLSREEIKLLGGPSGIDGLDVLPENDLIPTPNARLPEDPFEGQAWRLRLGSGSPDPEALVLSSGGAVVGAVPPGLPAFSLPAFSWEALVLLFQQALIIAFIGFAESVSIAKNAARVRGYRIDANQELVGQGLANIAGALVLTCPVSGSFSASAVNLSARARTGLSCVFAGLGALAVLLFFTGGLYYLPQPVLAVVVLRAVGNIMHLGDFQRLLGAQRQDGVIAVITFATTLLFAPHLDYGIAIGVLLSIASYFYRSMHPHISILSNGPDNSLRDAKVFKLAECRHIAVIHFQGPLFFGNSGVLEEYILKLLADKRELRHIHLVCTGITSLDTSGEDSLEMLITQAHKANVEVSFSGVVGDVAAMLDAGGILHMVGPENVFLTPREGVCAIYARISHCVDCRDCPFSQLYCRKRELTEGYTSFYPLNDKMYATAEAGENTWSLENEKSCK